MMTIVTSLRQTRPAKRRWVFFAIVLMALAVPASVFAQQLVLQLEPLNKLASVAHEVVDVTVDSSMLQIASGLLGGDKGNSASTKALIAGLKGVYVKSYEFDHEGAYTDADVEAVRAQLKAPWSRIVNVNSREDRELVEVYIWRENDQPGGLAVVVAEPKELTIVNIIGRIDLSQLAGLQGVLGIPKVPGAVPDVPAKKP